MVIEQNQQGQMAQLLAMEYPQLAGRIVSKTITEGFSQPICSGSTAECF